MTENHRMLLASRPQGLPTPDAWEHATEPVPHTGDGRFVVRVTHLSMDPPMSFWTSDVGFHEPPVGIGEVMRALGVGEVTASKHRDFPEGATVTGTFGLQDYAEPDGAGVVVVDADGAPTHLSLLGMTGRRPTSGCSTSARSATARPSWCPGRRARSAAWSGSSRSSRAAG